MARIPFKERCQARDHGKQCIRRKKKRGFCAMHYERQYRRGMNGETRTEFELRAIDAKAKHAAERAEYAKRAGLTITEAPTPDKIFAPYATKDEGEDPK